MKKVNLLTAVSAITLAATLAAPTPSDALPQGAGAVGLQAYNSAIASGSPEQLQGFLTEHPESPYANEVFGQLLHLAAHESRGFESSGNSRAAGGPDNPGRGRGVTGHY
jgi:hypothetical protein